MANDRFIQSRNLYLLSLLLGVYLMSIAGCGKSNSQASATISISTLSPATGPFATTVTISGTGFSANPANNIVQFNHVAATVQQASATQLTVIVPKQAGTGSVTVQVGSQTAMGPVFNYVYTAAVSTLAGSGVAGFADGLGTAAQFRGPQGIAIDGQGNLYVSDRGNNNIRKINPSGAVSTIAGNRTGGYVDSANGLDAEFLNPSGIQVDAQGNCYVGDQINNVIRKISPSGAVSTLAGNTTPGYVNGTGTAAEFFSPAGLTVDNQGNVFVADWANSVIREITASGQVSTFAGNRNEGAVNGSASSAEFYRPNDVAFDMSGNLYVADQYNNMIRKISPSGNVSILAGSGKKGFADGTGDTAEFNYPYSIALDASGNVYVADFGNYRIRMITPSGVVSTVAGSGTSGTADGTGANAQFMAPSCLVLDAKGNIYVGDYLGNNIRMITME